MTLRALFATAAALSLAAATTSVPSSAAPVPTLAPSQLAPGQRATVRTVFRGDSIETFEAEIVGVLAGGRTEGDLILARATSERVVKSGVAAGMSGSPVYVDGRLIGALSSGWSFTRDPLFGITPIGEMLEVLKQPANPAVDASAGPSGIEPGAAEGAPRFGAFRWSGDDGEAPASPDPLRLAARAGGPPALPLPLAGGGLNPLARELLAPEFRARGFALTPGGRAARAPAASAPLEPGAAVAVDVLRGDLQLSAIGTLTWRDGDRVLIFGHPFFQAGEIRLPLSTAEIVTIVASDQSSFKLGVPGREIGTVTQDRRAAVAGTLGPAPHLMPLRIRIEGAGPRPQSFAFECVDDRGLAPLLVATAATNSVLESGGTGIHQTYRWSLALHRRGVPPLVLSDVAAGESPAQDLLGGLVAPLRFLFNNPSDRLQLDSVVVSVAVRPGRDQWTLRGARALESAVRPGRDLHVRVELERWRGGREVRDLVVPVPEELPDGRYQLMVGGGGEVSRYEASKLPGRYRPATLEEAWLRFARLRTGDRLYALMLAKAPEVTSDGRDYPELPSSAYALMAGPQVGGDRVRRGELAVLGERSLALDGAVRGELMLQINVDSRTP